MTLRDFLKVVDKDQFININVQLYDMQFTTVHSAEFYLACDDGLISREVAKIYTNDEGLHVKLKNY